MAHKQTDEEFADSIEWANAEFRLAIIERRSRRHFGIKETVSIGQADGLVPVQVHLPRAQREAPAVQEPG